MSSTSIPRPRGAARGDVPVRADTTRPRANALAERLEQGAQALASFAEGLTEAEWQTRIPRDGRKIGVVVHHVASMYPLEIEASLTLAAGKPVTGMTSDVINEINARHAGENDAVTKQGALELLRRNSVALRRCAAHVSVHARGSPRTAQLSPPRPHPRGFGPVTGAPRSRHPAAGLNARGERDHGRPCSGLRSRGCCPWRPAQAPFVAELQRRVRERRLHIVAMVKGGPPSGPTDTVTDVPRGSA
jgi:hypothetical protein